MISECVTVGGSIQCHCLLVGEQQEGKAEPAIKCEFSGFLVLFLSKTFFANSAPTRVGASPNLQLQFQLACKCNDERRWNL